MKYSSCVFIIIFSTCFFACSNTNQRDLEEENSSRENIDILLVEKYNNILNNVAMDLIWHHDEIQSDIEANSLKYSSLQKIQIPEVLKNFKRLYEFKNIIECEVLILGGKSIYFDLYNRSDSIFNYALAMQGERRGIIEGKENLLQWGMVREIKIEDVNSYWENKTEPRIIKNVIAFHKYLGQNIEIRLLLRPAGTTPALRNK